MNTESAYRAARRRIRAIEELYEITAEWWNAQLPPWPGSLTPEYTAALKALERVRAERIAAMPPAVREDYADALQAARMCEKA